MSDMKIDYVVEEEASNKAKASIDGCHGPIHEMPGGVFELGQIRVGVVKIGDCHDPVVQPQVWNYVETYYRAGAHNLTEVEEHISHG